MHTLLDAILLREGRSLLALSREWDGRGILLWKWDFALEEHHRSDMHVAGFDFTGSFCAPF